ncbi:hypothetical protein [Lutimonas vermicola]|uniref:Uncharacterized protein n=1 Tax=Lutimonas vermicola TaxID=414288 RepID=A0ABU9L4M3_9FLAO
MKDCIEFQDEDILVSEFHRFLVQETDMGWFKQYVTITYKNKIENFNVRILWLPTNNPAPIHKISGPGIIEFTDPIKSTRFTITRGDLVFTPERMGIDSLEQRWSLLDKTFELQFETRAIKDRITVGSVTEPFFFYDVDFDNDPELLITEVAAGQQLSNTYKVYNLDESSFASDSDQITNLKPFSLLNDFTEFNKMDKTIHIDNYLGGGNTETSIYKKVNPSEFKLISIIKYSWEEKVTFEFVDDEMIEVKSEQINEYNN